ncbi:hypothetical protein EDD17DRAFT_1822290 [Pisolithus thermaeus]|nr:hypothetical protein EDD17DRAFT_1822290 [Pisolithus thermaeus]
MVPSVNSANFCPLDEALDQVELKAAIHTLEGACAQLCMTLAHPGHKEMNLVQDYDYSCVRLAVRGKITNILVDYPKGLHIIELSKKINAEPKKLSHIMRLLTMRGCYSEDSPRAHGDIELPPLNGKSCHYHEFFCCSNYVHPYKLQEIPLYTESEFPFNKYSTVVYIGGGIGAFSLPLAKVHKHMKITVHNLPEALRPGMYGDSLL